MSPKSLRDTVVITGAAGGIGRVLTSRYLAKYPVVAIDCHEESLERLRSELGVGPEKLRTHCMDVGDPRAYDDFAQRFDEWGLRPFIWINNAGVAVIDDFAAIAEEDFDRVLRVNLQGVVYGSRAAMQLMGQRGSVVNISSMNGMVPAPFMSAYGASKHAVVGFTRCVQEELRIAQSGLKMILVMPGFIDVGVFREGLPKLSRKWVSKFAGTEEDCVDEIVAAVEQGRREVIPTLNGKLMRAAYRTFPFALRKASDFLIARNWREFLGLDPMRSRK